MRNEMKDIKEFSLEELKSIFQEWGDQPFRAQQVFSWIYQKGAKDFAGMSNLPLDLRKRLEGNFYIFHSRVAKVLKSEDGTKKLLIELPDKNLIEAVSIPAEKRITGCVSSQAGCKFSCAFCASGIPGFKRNLTCGEILEEVLYLGDLTHIVFMGTGEPLDNYDNVLKAVRMINAPHGLNIGARRITISTCGIVPGIKRLIRESLQFELSISLHAADDKVRAKLMPVAKIYPLKELMQACREYVRATNRQITFEYILIKGVNSDLQSARKLSTILAGLESKVNLIPANTIKESGISAPDKAGTQVFRDFLAKSGVHVTVRKSRGEDIDAACGQLRLNYAKLSK
jgi:23S rRNA (adenine2503-C2)-methyltransferase